MDFAKAEQRMVFALICALGATVQETGPAPEGVIYVAFMVHFPSITLEQFSLIVEAAVKLDYVKRAGNHVLVKGGRDVPKL